MWPGVSAYESRGRLTTLARSRSAEMCTIMTVSVQWQGAPPSRYVRRSSSVMLSRPSVPTIRTFMPPPALGRFFMSLNASTREMSSSRPVSTACPIPADPSTTTDSAVTARMAQRGFLRRTGGFGGRRDGRGARCGRGAPRPAEAGTRDERGGVDKGTPPRGRAPGRGA